MKTVTVKSKILWGSIILSGAFVLQAGVTGVMDIRSSSDVDELTLIGNAIQNHMQADMMHDAVRGSVYRELYLARGGDLAGAAAAAREVADYTGELGEAVAANRKLPLGPDLQVRLGKVGVALQDYTSEASTIARLAASDPQGAQARLAKFDRAFHELEVAQEDIAGHLEKTMAEVSSETGDQLSLSLWVLAFVSIGFVAMLVWAATHLRRHVVEPIDALAGHLNAMTRGDFTTQIERPVAADEIGAIQLAAHAFRETALAKGDADAAQKQVVNTLGEHLESLSGGNLSCRITTSFPPSYEALRHAFNASLERLAGLMQEVRASANSVTTGVREIRAASDDLARRNEQQSSRLEETAGAMNQVTTSVQSTADGAGEVQQSAAAAHREASEGSEVIGRAVEAMGSIENGARGIAQIVDVIDGIAFQTNLLALNAGVEAARAGDAGKGFAVVANEVRALAQRSAEAAKDIKQLINQSSAQVADGVSLVGEAGNVFTQIVHRVGEISAMISTIAKAAETQSGNVVQVNAAVGEMDRMTQQNAAMVEETTAAAHSLADEAQKLAGLVGQFQIGQSNPDNSATVTPMPAPKTVRTAPARRTNLAVQTDAAIDADWSAF